MEFVITIQNIGKTLIFEQNFKISNPTSKVCEFSGSVILKFIPKTLTVFRLKVAKIFIFWVLLNFMYGRSFSQYCLVKILSRLRFLSVKVDITS